MTHPFLKLSIFFYISTVCFIHGLDRVGAVGIIILASWFTLFMVDMRKIGKIIRELDNGK